jgi:K+-transporting ATPase ATPase A chain
MNPGSFLLYGLFLVIVVALANPIGSYMARVYRGEPTRFDPLLRPIERALYRICGVDERRDMLWTEYASAFLAFSLAGTLFLYALLRLQHYLPGFDPSHLTTPMTPDLAANTALSFSTTTTWQAYSGESSMSCLIQTVGLTAQNFLAAAAGMAVGVAVIRGFVREKSAGLGSFWVDLVRTLLWLLIPISVVGSLALIWQGVPCNLSPYTQAHTLEGPVQTIAQGPVAALTFIENLGTNGGGLFAANGAHPYQNPTPLANLLQMLAIAVLPAAFMVTFGKMTGRVRDGWLLLGVMVALFAAGLVVCDRAEQHGVANISRTGNLATAPTSVQAGGNMEGKETRFGIGATVLTAVTTSNGATGNTNASHDSFTPIGGAVPLVNMLLGEMIFGGLGTGLYSILMVALLGLFITGLMIGRTPEYLGKQIGPAEIKLVVLYSLAMPAVVLVLTAAAVVTHAGLAGLTTNGGPHGLTEILYAYTSCAANNGQAFAGLSANSPFYNVSTMVAMMVGRFFLAVPALGLASRFARQGRRAPGPGTLQTDTLLFGIVIAGAAILVGALSFIPALALGPVAEHVMLPK